MMSELITFFNFFQIICFCFLLFFIKRIFVKYISPSLGLALDQRKEEINKKQIKHEQLLNDIKKTQNDFDQQTTYGLMLLEKIGQWKVNKQKKDDLTAQEYEQFQKNKQHYFAQQKEWLEMMYATKRVLPQALSGVQKELKEQFEQPNDQQDFLDSICSTFQKEGQ